MPVRAPHRAYLALLSVLNSTLVASGGSCSFLRASPEHMSCKSGFKILCMGRNQTTLRAQRFADHAPTRPYTAHSCNYTVPLYYRGMYPPTPHAAVRTKCTDSCGPVPQLLAQAWATQFLVSIIREPACVRVQQSCMQHVFLARLPGTAAGSSVLQDAPMLVQNFTPPAVYL